MGSQRVGSETGEHADSTDSSEASLREQVARYRRAELAVGEGLWEWELDTGVAYHSPRWLELLGYAAGELPAHVDAFLELVHPDDRPRMSVEQLRPGMAFDLELRVRHRSGDYRWFRSRSLITCDDGVLRMTGSLLDIGDRKRMEARWRQAERLAGLGAWEHDLVSDVLWWSDEQRRIQGIAPEVPPSQALFVSHLHGEDLIEFEQNYREAFERDQVEASFRIVRPDGAVRHVHGVATVERDTRGQAVRIFGINQDVTETIEAARALERSLAEKDMLLRESHHRVNNNLAVVSGLVHLHAQRLGSPRDAELLLGLARRIKAMALAHEQLRRASDLGRVRMAEYIGALAEHAAEAEVDVDAVALPLELAMPIGQIVSELLGNALRHGGTDRVHVRLQWREQAGEILVEDRGPGFPPDFEPESTHGLGWLLIRMLTRQIGGWVEIDSCDGARVRITVPRGERSDGDGLVSMR